MGWGQLAFANKAGIDNENCRGAGRSRNAIARTR
jgi:hypothetical protein